MQNPAELSATEKESLPILALESPVGYWLLSSDNAGVQALDYVGPSIPEGMRSEPKTRLEQRLSCMLSRYFRGERVDFRHVPLAPAPVSPFLKQVMHALREVPYGEVRSYRWLAERIGKPKALRAVGGALSRNPLPIILPCHRIIASNGSQGGFMGQHADGAQIKAFLLKTEGIVLPSAPGLLRDAE